VDVLFQDLRFALRSLARTPGYTAVVIAVMALGIGINTMVFSMVYGVIYRPWPVAHPDRVFTVAQLEPKRNEDPFELSFMNLRDVRAHVPTFEQVGGWWNVQATVTIDREPEQLRAATVTYDLLPTIGWKPILGHGFTADDEIWGHNWIPVLISERIWRSRYHADPHIVGRPLRINGRTRTIVGVMPMKFRWPEDQDFWIPMGFNPADETRDSYAIRTVGRLAPGVTRAQAEAQVRTLMAGIARDNPKTSEGVQMGVRDINEDQVGSVAATMLLMLGSVVFVLMIACANVANLMLARATGRRREISLRLALGATRARVVRLLLTESLVVAVAGAAIGILLAHWGNRVWVSTIPFAMPMWLDLSIDTPVLLYTVGITAFAGIVFGLAPALHAGDMRLGEALRDGSAQAGSSRGRNRLRASLVVAEIALSLVLLVGAGLMMRSFVKRSELSHTVRTEGVFTSRVLLPIATYPQDVDRTNFFHAVLAQIAALPGVRAVSMVSTLPLNRDNNTRRILAASDPHADAHNAPRTNFAACSPGYFSTLGIPLVAGRDFNANDGPHAPRVVIVNQAAAHRLWPSGSAIGQRVKFAGQPDSVGWATVVGVVGDVVQNVEEPGTNMNTFAPHDQDAFQFMSIVTQSSVPPADLAARIRRVIQSHDPDLALIDPLSMTEFIHFNLWLHRLFSGLFATFAIIALLIAGIGLYGVMAYSVAQRTQEIGLRMALGADRSAVLRLVVGQAMRLTVIGCGIGLASAYALTRVMAGILFEVSPNDPPTFIGVALILALSAALAAWLPARRATRVDPMVALRYE